MSEPLLTARELGERIGLKPDTVLDKWERGELPGYKFGLSPNAPVRFDLDEVLASGRKGRAREEGYQRSRPRTRPVEDSSSYQRSTNEEEI